MNFAYRRGREQYMKKVHKLFRFFILLFLTFFLGSCSVKSAIEGNMNNLYCSNLIVSNASYNAENDSTEFSCSVYIHNGMNVNTSNPTFTFDLYKNEIKTGQCEKTFSTCEMKHNTNKVYTLLFSTKGQHDNVVIYDWTCDISSLWETYTAWFICTIVGVGILSVLATIYIIMNEGDLSDLFDSEYLIYLAPLGIALLGSGIGSWINSNWIPICIVGVGIIALAIITLIILAIYHIVVFLLDDLDYVSPTIVCGFLLLVGFILGCIFWKWWAMLLILLGIVLVVFIIVLIIQKVNNYGCDESIDYNEEDELNSIEERKKKRTTKPYVSSISFEDIAGLEEPKKLFYEKAVLPFKHPEVYKKYGKKMGGGILLYGLPGTGKTMFAEAACKELGATFIPIKCSDIKSKWYGESEENVKLIFEEARKAKKAIIFFDEFEAIGAKRADGDEWNGNNDLVPEILSEMQGIGSQNDDEMLLIIAATNKPWSIDSAFLRPGRFDELIYVPLPDERARKYLIQKQLEKMPLSKDFDFDYLVEKTEGCNGADIKEMCEKLKMVAIHKEIETKKDHIIDMSDVTEIVPLISSSVSKEDIEELENFRKTRE